MSWLDGVREALGGAAEGALDVTSRVRYGMAPQEKDALVYGRKLPGAPSYVEDPAAAERYASSYLGAKKWGRLPAEVLNALAFADLTKPQPQSETTKAQGALGAQRGAEAGASEEQRRRARLEALFRGERIG